MIIAGYKALKDKKAPGDDAQFGRVEAWAEKMYMEKLQTVDVVDRKDGLDLAELAIEQAERKPLSEYVSILLGLPKLAC